MGIRGGWRVVNGKEVDYSEVKGKVLCIDGNLVLFSCINSTDIRYITEYALEKVGVLLSLGVDPIFVFDGKRPLFKREKIEKRRVLEKEVPSSSSTQQSTNCNTQDTNEQSNEQAYHQMSMEDFSTYQIDRIVQRHKYIKEMTRERMHGESDLFYNLKPKKEIQKKIREERRKERKEEEKQRKRKNKARQEKKEYKETEKEMEKIKDLLFETEEKNEEIKSVRSKRENKEIKEKSFPLAINTSTTKIIPNKAEQSEYQRELERYILPKEDSLITGESIPKETLSIGCKTITDILDLLSIKYVISPTESDCVYAEIEKAVDTDGVVTEDSDILLFSGRPIYRHLFKQTKPLKVYNTEDTPLEYTWEEMVIFAWMLGSDYTPGIETVGVKTAKKIVLRYKEEKKKRDSNNPTEIDLLSNLFNPTDRTIDTDLLRKAFQAIVPSILFDRLLPSLFHVKMIYGQILFKVKMENLKTKEISIPQIIQLLNRKTLWIKEKKKDFLDILEKENKKRKNNS